jgi:hypothetical protein
MLPILAGLLAGCGDTDAGRSAPPPGSHDIVGFVRLGASGTEPNAVWPWPREAEDAIATLRDDDPDTGWAAPVGARSTLTLDALPWLGREIELSWIGMTFEGARPSDVVVRLLHGCGGDPLRTFHWGDPGRGLDLRDSKAGCVEIDLSVADGVRFRLTGLSVYTTDPSAAPAEPAVGPTAATAGSVPAMSGVIEGFYGVPWSWRERAAMVRMLARSGLGLYLYAPKDEPLHRSRWREPYPAEDLERFATLDRLADALGIALYFGISPFIDFDAATDADYGTLRDKVAAMLDAGITRVAVLADDIEMEGDVTVDGSLGALHVDVADRLLADLQAVAPEASLLFVPTVYSDERLDAWEGGAAYLEALARLDPGIRVLWTGPATSNATLSATDLARFSSLVGRRPLVWENFWANDGGDGFQGRLPLAPYSGRGPDLPGAVAGIAHNPMIQGALSRLAAAAFGYWLAHPETTDAGAARAAAARLESGGEFYASADASRDGDLLDFVMRLWDGHAQQVSRFAEMDAAMDALDGRLDALDSLPAAELGSLLPILGRMAAIESEIWHSGLDPDLADELAFPMRRVRLDAEMALWALASLGEKMAGRGGEAYEASARQVDEEATACRFFFSRGRARDLLNRIAAVEPRDLAFEAPERNGAPAPECRAGEALSWSPFDGALSLEAFGLPGATAAGGTLVWTPPHPGRYHGVVIVSGDRGFSLVFSEFACR